LAKNGSFGFAKCWLLFRAKPNMSLVRLAKIVFEKCALGKNKNIEAWLLGRLSDVSIVQSLVYFLFCHSFFLCRLLG
jgi:hypothetical protein